MIHEYDPATDTTTNRFESFPALGTNERGGIMARIAKAVLGTDPRKIETFSMDTLPIFRQLAPELFARGWVPTIRKDAFDRFGTPIYPWNTIGESEPVNEEGRFIALVRMPRNMHAAGFRKPMDPQEMVDAAEADALGFGPFYSRTSHLVIATCDTADSDPATGEKIEKPNGDWDGEVVVPNMDYACNPLEQIKQYGTGLFEGIGVEMNDDGEVTVFRLKEHWNRMSQGGEWLGMPKIPYALFEKMVMETIQANWAYIPPAGKGRLYVRPDWFDHGPQLKVGNSGRFTLLMCAIPIGSAESYFTRGRKKFFMAKGRARVAEGGNAGKLKADGHYSGTIDLIGKAGKKGMAGVIFTNSAGDRIEETNASSVIFIKRSPDGKHRIITPSLAHGTLLNSITRRTILDLAREKGWTVEERDISPNELASMTKEGDMEAVAVGTAAAIAPIHEIQVGSVDPETNEIHEDGELIKISHEGEDCRGPVSMEIFQAIMAVKSGKAQKEMRARLKATTNPTGIANLERQLSEQESWLTIVPPPDKEVL
ncbi:MAG: Branched-chain-amino-acid aminotransferase [Candidatus Peregrinibacteria bacterium GW2011_GWA2_43_8]|nr:MAG: Branched-chain-amino-acid aminotransferase [Candidatus Peregrinibacteria bacterium GW2011_GWA2_43_8]